MLYCVNVFNFNDSNLGIIFILCRWCKETNPWPRNSEVEKFVQANTQELAKDKWLCPLSGKKFKGPDFVRKHLFNKHAEKVEEVRVEVGFML